MTEHTHTTKDGLIVRCYHSCKGVITSPAFWIGVTLSFPIEHWLWTTVPPFNWVAGYFGLIAH